MQIVAFDYGTKKIGVAVGQTETYTSSPLQIIYNDHEKTNWNEIRMLIDEWKPDLILIGKPINMDGTESEIMKKVDNFFKKLQKMSNTNSQQSETLGTQLQMMDQMLGYQR